MFATLRSYFPINLVNSSGDVAENSEEVVTPVLETESEPSPEGSQGLIEFAKWSGKVFSERLQATTMNVSHKFLDEFNRAQSEFVVAREEVPGSPALPPWHPAVTGLSEAKTVLFLREQICGLSREKRNFLRAPPSESSFDWSPPRAASLMKTAVCLLQEDPELSSLRFELVPRKIKEDDFWRNYFYRISLIQQSAQLSTSANVPLDSNSPKSETNSIESTSPSPVIISRDISETSTDYENPTLQPEPSRVDGTKSPLSDEDLEAELIRELREMEASGVDVGPSTAAATAGEGSQGSLGSGSCVSLDEELERELLAEIANEEADRKTT